MFCFAALCCVVFCFVLFCRGIKLLKKQVHFLDRLTENHISSSPISMSFRFSGLQFCPDNLRKKDEDSILAHYLSRIKLNPDDKEIYLPEEMPKGFHLIHKRSCNRTTFVHVIEETSFRIEVSEENTWVSDGCEEQQRASVSACFSYVKSIQPYPGRAF